MYTLSPSRRKKEIDCDAASLEILLPSSSPSPGVGKEERLHRRCAQGRKARGEQGNKIPSLRTKRLPPSRVVRIR